MCTVNVVFLNSFCIHSGLAETFDWSSYIIFLLNSSSIQRTFHQNNNDLIISHRISFEILHLFFFLLFYLIYFISFVMNEQSRFSYLEAIRFDPCHRPLLKQTEKKMCVEKRRSWNEKKKDFTFILENDAFIHTCRLAKIFCMSWFRSSNGECYFDW